MEILEICLVAVLEIFLLTRKESHDVSLVDARFRGGSDGGDVDEGGLSEQCDE